MTEADAAYFHNRFDVERARATTSTIPDVASAHRLLAERYEALLLKARRNKESEIVAS